MKKFLAALKRLLIKVAMFSVLIFLVNIKAFFKDKDIRDGIEAEVARLESRDNSPHLGKQSLEILSIGQSLSDTQIKGILDRAQGKGGAFTYSYANTGVYTMSAQGINSKHYLVNSYLEGYEPFEVENVMMPLYVLAQRKSYMLDSEQYDGRAEVWQTSRQAFLYPRGDCEDHALALADWLIAMNEDARVVVGDYDGEGHAWVVLFREGKEYLLEATQKSGLSRSTPYPIAKLYPDYHPKFMFNREGFWENSGSKYTTAYSGEHWVKKSNYRYGMANRSS